jgi:hypothetical protein
MVEAHDVALTRACMLMVQVEVLLVQIGILGAQTPVCFFGLQSYHLDLYLGSCDHRGSLVDGWIITGLRNLESILREKGVGRSGRGYCSFLVGAVALMG